MSQITLAVELNILFITALSELRKVLFLAPSVCGFLFVNEMSLETMNGFAPNSHGRCVWSLPGTSLKVKVKRQRSRSPGDKKRHFRPFRRPACGLCLVKHKFYLASSLFNYFGAEHIYKIKLR